MHIYYYNIFWSSSSNFYRPISFTRVRLLSKGENMQYYKMFIGGEWVDAASGKTYRAINPATEEEIAEIPLADTEDVNRAVVMARRALSVWSQKPREERAGIINRMAILLRENAEELAWLDVLDHGTPIKLARMQCEISAKNLEYTAQASRSLSGDMIPVGSDALYFLQREPIGVATLIIPWNSPILMVTSKMGACLATGNTCIIKPSAIDSLVTLKLIEIISKLDIPPGIINVLTGPGSTVGKAVVAHPDINFISFTGSSETGKEIMSIASRTLKRIQMELGGKNPFIVLEDADINQAVSQAARSAFHNTGMVCASPGRYYLHEAIYDEFLEKFITAAKQIIVGDPGDEKTDMGPVVSAEHRDRVEGYIKSGTEEGATLLLGGERPDKPPLNKGYYILPTVFTDVKPNMEIFREEIFGPVACFIKFNSEEEMIESANDTVYGLCASVWTKDVTRGLKIVKQINAGAVGVNSSRFVTPDTPWGGFKESGFGKENSIYGLEEYTQLKLMTIGLP
jgi:betaine-aldehyde dehydrogenase